MGYLKAGASLIKGITNFVSNLIKKAYQAIKPTVENLLDKLSVQKVNLTFDVLTKEVQAKFQEPDVAQVAVCNLKQLVILQPTVPEWKNLHESGITHMMITIGYDKEIKAAYFYQDLCNGTDVQVDQFINKTGEGMVVVSR